MQRGASANYHFYRQGNVYSLNIVFDVPTTSANTWITIGTVSTDYIDTTYELRQTSCVVNNNSGNITGYGMFNITTSGEVKFKTVSNVSSLSFSRIVMTWIRKPDPEGVE